MNTEPGRSCPLWYRYCAAELRSEPERQAHTVYVIGGLYGNSQALQAILAMKDFEQRSGDPPTLVFNGDFNWLNVDFRDFGYINETVLAAAASLGNVEAELFSNAEDPDCGCSYPPHIPQIVVKRSNAIANRLRATASQFQDLKPKLKALPRYRVFKVAGERVAVLHGDPESLSGWQFAVESLDPPDEALLRQLGDRAVTRTAMEHVATYFRQADVRVFAVTHTGLPFMQDFEVDDLKRLIANNGDAGLPNFQATTFGVLTRISANPSPISSLYGIRIGALYCDALPIHYDQDAWHDAFLSNWPEGSPAYATYYQRLIRGPTFTLKQAARGAVEQPSEPAY